LKDKKCCKKLFYFLKKFNSIKIRLNFGYEPRAQRVSLSWFLFFPSFQGLFHLFFAAIDFLKKRKKKQKMHFPTGEIK